MFCNILGSPYFVLGYFGTDNTFTFKDITAKSIHIHSEFRKRGVEVLCFGSDGALSNLKSQKHLINFGSLHKFGPVQLVVDYTSDYQANQDPYHIAKKLKNVLFDMSDLLRIGRYSATVGHLVIVLKKFPKILHGLNASDLDPADKMNYKYVYFFI